MPYRSKLLLIALLVLVPLFGLAITFITQSRNSLLATEKKIVALGFVAPIAKRIQLTQEHRGLSFDVVDNSVEVKEAVRILKTEIRNEVEAIDSSIREQLTAFQADGKPWQEITDEWQRILHSYSDENSAEAFVSHTRLIRRLLLLQRELASISGLQSNSSIEVHDLTEMLITELPELLERIGQMRAKGTAALADRVLGNEGQVDFHSGLKEMQKTIAEYRLRVGRAVAREYGPSTEIFRSFTQLEGIVANIEAMINREILSRKFRVSPLEYYDLCTSAIHIGYTHMSDILLPSVNNKLTVRASQIRTDMHLMLLFLIGGFICVAFLIVGLYFSTMRSIRQLINGVDAISRGELTARIEISTNDEMAEVAQSFNDMMHALHQMLSAIPESEVETRATPVGIGTATGLSPVRNEMFSSLVATRTRALERALDEARSSELAKAQFLANMSHEIRTPMNAIIGMANLMRREGVTAKQADRLNKIDGASHHLLGLINDILDLSKIEAGKLSIDSIPISLDQIVAHVRDLTDTLATSKGLRLIIASPKLPSNLLGDPMRIQQSLINLISNAIKFTEIGSVTLKIEIIEETIEQVSVKFSVIDTGVGIPLDKMERLFSNFEQGDISTTRKYGGTGLGLSITKCLVELMGGHVGAESVEGMGSTFWLKISLKLGPAGIEPVIDDHTDPAELILKREFSGSRILLADDDPMNLEMTESLLLDCGLIVDTANNGVDALRMALEGDFAIILMDMQMPRLDGVDVAQRIRASSIRQTPIVALTANATVKDRMACLDAGMNDFLSKPFNPDMLFGITLKWLSLRNRQETATGISTLELGSVCHIGVASVGRLAET